MRDIANGMRFSGVLLLLIMAGPLTLGAQDPRGAQVARAFREFDGARRLQMLTSVVNPVYGPPTGAWAVGVQLLAQTLLEDGKDSAAAVWLRWAVRISPGLQPDTVTFLPNVVAALRSARDYVASTAAPADDLVETTWLWPAQATGEPVGRLQVTPPAQVPTIQVGARGIGRIVPGGSIPFHIGSYYIMAGAPGFDSVRVTREVLPGVTTVLDFRLRSVGSVANRRPPVSSRSTPRRTRKKGFPVVWAGLGAVSAIAVVAILTKSGTPEPTGGLTIAIPSP